MITGRHARQGHGSAACRPGAPGKNENSVDCSALVDQGSLSTAQRFGRFRGRSDYLKFYRFAELFSNMRPSTMRAPTSIRTARDDSARSGTVGQAISLARRLASDCTFATLHFHHRFALRISRQRHHRIKDQAAQPLLYGKKSSTFCWTHPTCGPQRTRQSVAVAAAFGGKADAANCSRRGALDFIRVYHSTRSLSCL
jgi:hypothetical protein